MTSVFDQEHYLTLNVSRAAVLRPVLAELRRQFHMCTAADVGCGVGYFSALLQEEGFQVTGFDGRAENAEECRRRQAGTEFLVADIEDPAIAAQRFDTVVCLGLLYHLENPFRGIRNLAQLTRHVLVLESMCVPSPEPVMSLRDEWQGEDQGLNYVAFYPSEACLVKMLYCAGFAAVYRFARMPDHGHFRETVTAHQVRTMLVAARAEVKTPLLDYVSKPANSADPWSKAQPGLVKAARRIGSWLGRLTSNGRRPPGQQRDKP